jgi:hypothetical protein
MSADYETGFYFMSALFMFVAFVLCGVWMWFLRKIEKLDEDNYQLRKENSQLLYELKEECEK